MHKNKWNCDVYKKMTRKSQKTTQKDKKQHKKC